MMLMMIVIAAGVLQQDAKPSTPEHQVLVFSKTSGFRHDSIEAGVKALQSIGGDDFSVVQTEDPARFTDEDLSPFDAVVFLNTTMDVLDPSQQHHTSLQAMVAVSVRALPRPLQEAYRGLALAPKRLPLDEELLLRCARVPGRIAHCLDQLLLLC